jgi:16S rRNA (guanine527-N7)-methyltransferase
LLCSRSAPPGVGLVVSGGRFLGPLRQRNGAVAGPTGDTFPGAADILSRDGLPAVDGVGLSSVMTSREFADRVRRRARRAGVLLPEELVEPLGAYYRLLATWNAKINLTALDLAGGADRAVDRLLIEPLAAARYLPAGPVRLIDIGSGGGSPGIPIKLARPDLQLTLVEAKTRKCAFLREAGRQLGIDLRVETARYELLLGRPAFHEAFDVVTLRAVRVESRVLVGIQAFLKPGGECLLFRGPAPGEPTVALPPWLVPAGAYPLVDDLQSRLVVLRKRDADTPDPAPAGA